jgi:hypothetical protein
MTQIYHYTEYNKVIIINTHILHAFAAMNLFVQNKSYFARII